MTISTYISNKLIALNFEKKIHPTFLVVIEFTKKIYYIAHASIEKFKKDSCGIRSSSIAYAIAISVIPILTIMVRFASIDRVALRASLASFLAANGMADATELLGILDEILGRANQIAGLGILFMLYSATNLVRNLEEAFNHIYRVRSDRPMVYRFALYIASFAIIPTLIIFSTSAAHLAISKLQPTQPTAIHNFSGSNWILHESGMLWKHTNNKVKQINLYKRANTGAPFRELFIDESNNKIGSSWEIAGKDYFAKGLEESDLYNSFWIKSWEDTLYVFTNHGLFLYSKDKGNTWQYNRIYFKSTKINKPQIRDIYITKAGNILFLIDVNSKTGILHYNATGDWRYNKLEGIYNHFGVLESVSLENLGKFNNGLYLLGKGIYRYSSNMGVTFGINKKERYGNRNIDITSIGYNQKHVYFSGNNGELWFQNGSTQIRPNLRLNTHSTQTKSLSFMPNGNMFFYGNNEVFRFSQNNGDSWLKVNNKELHSQNISAHQVLSDGSILLANQNQSLYHLSNPVDSSIRDSQGFPIIQFQIKTLKKLPLWFTMTGKILVVIFIFSSCYLLFILTYKLVPNAKVTWKAASTGSLFTSITILGFFVMFRMWITGFTTTGYIYGVWAAIPLGMLVILSSTAIILFGLELAYIIQHPILYSHQKKKSNIKRDSLLWSSLTLLSMIYHRLYGENSALTDEQAVHYFLDNSGRLEYIRDALLEARLISYNDISGEYYPVKPASEISIENLQKSLIEQTLKIPPRSLNIESLNTSDLQIVFDQELEQLTSSLEKKKNTLSLADLLPILADKKGTRIKSVT